MLHYYKHQGHKYAKGFFRDKCRKNCVEQYSNMNSVKLHALKKILKVHLDFNLQTSANKRHPTPELIREDNQICDRYLMFANAIYTDTLVQRT